MSEPLVPVHNSYEFYCLICKYNVSIYTKGPREVLRHYSSERHMRKDQRRRYEYLSVTDTVTATVKHRVRGKDWTPYQLELELPKFNNAVLVDIGDKMPCYGNYMAGQQNVVTSPDSRVESNYLCLVLCSQSLVTNPFSVDSGAIL